MRWHILLLENKSSVVMSVIDGVVVWLCKISVREMHMSATFWKLTNSNTSYTYIALARKFLIVVHSTWMDILIGYLLTGDLLMSSGFMLR